MPDQPATLAEALVALQAALPVIRKGETAQVEHRGGGSHSYRYADYRDILDDVRPHLTKHGFAWTCKPTMEAGEFGLRYRLIHAPSGEEDTGFYPIPVNLPAQARGSEITYARRYCLTAVLDIALDDDDGKAATDAWTPPANPRTRKADRHQAARSGPLPDDDWTTGPPEDAPGSITEGRLTELHIAFTRKGITQREDRLAYTMSALDLPELASSKDLSEAQGIALVKHLKEDTR